MNKKILLVTPPLSQLNCPYPATAYLKQYLTKENIENQQVDLSIELVLAIFSKTGLTKVFAELNKISKRDSYLEETICMADYYINTVDYVINYLQKKDQTLAYRITSRQFLPETGRFFDLQDEDLEWAFGSMGIQDKAKYFCTIYIENLNNIIQKYIDNYFGLSRYAERLALSLTHFETLEKELIKREKNPTIIDEIYLELFKNYLEDYQPDLVALSTAFPGNLYFALKTVQYIKKHYPEIKTLMGGGYVNTELREISSLAFFKYIDFLTLDDGEGPLHRIYDYICGKIEQSDLLRTFVLVDNQIKYFNNNEQDIVTQQQTGFADYTDLDLGKYLSLIEINNPMHRLWSDGCWNKMTLAHGCYWRKCVFCDTELDYIKRYETVSVEELVDRIEKIILQTGQTGFHFVDEAAPPALLKKLAIEIIKRELTISWWTNIRFETNFSADLCRLMAESGCIAVSGGLEVASDKILKKIDKGVSLEQAAMVTANFSDAGIMVHAYLMYGFPGQTAQDTINALEFVKQLFLHGCIQSAYWHRFSMTEHSIIAKNQKNYGVKKTGPTRGDFAYNDLFHEDLNGSNHEKFGDGLKKALFNFMHGVGLDKEVSFWFNFKVKNPEIAKDYVYNLINKRSKTKYSDKTIFIWAGNIPLVKNRGKDTELVLYNKAEKIVISLDTDRALWLSDFLEKMKPDSKEEVTYLSLKESYEQKFKAKISSMFENKAWKILETNRLFAV